MLHIVVPACASTKSSCDGGDTVHELGAEDYVGVVEHPLLCNNVIVSGPDSSSNSHKRNRLTFNETTTNWLWEKCVFSMFPMFWV